MAKHVHIHVHGAPAAAWEESKHPRDGGRFAAGGSGHNEPSGHSSSALAAPAVAERRAGLESSGFKHEGSEGSSK